MKEQRPKKSLEQEEWFTFPDIKTIYLEHTVN